MTKKIYSCLLLVFVFFSLASIPSSADQTCEEVCVMYYGLCTAAVMDNYNVAVANCQQSCMNMHGWLCFYQEYQPACDDYWSCFYGCFEALQFIIDEGMAQCNYQADQCMQACYPQ